MNYSLNAVHSRHFLVCKYGFTYELSWIPSESDASQRAMHRLRSHVLDVSKCASDGLAMEARCIHLQERTKKNQTWENQKSVCWRLIRDRNFVVKRSAEDATGQEAEIYSNDRLKYVAVGSSPVFLRVLVCSVKLNSLLKHFGRITSLRVWPFTATGKFTPLITMASRSRRVLT